MLPNVLLIDNYDSYTYNLVQMLHESSLCNYQVCQCKDIGTIEISAFDKIIISPGAGVPGDYPILKEIILRYCAEKAILGVCLGHQAIAEAFGLNLYNLGQVYHGIRRRITLTTDAGDLFTGIPRQFYAGLYHSWAVSENAQSLFKITATNQDGIIMGLSHLKYDIEGVQFHPESYMTDFGKVMITNWLKRKKAAF